MTIQMFDLAAAEPDRRFSPYCWRTRLALAHKGLPVETINQAAGLFLRKIANWNKMLVPLIKGTATIYRPNVTLFLLLKMERLSESDLGDCIEFIKFSKKKNCSESVYVCVD